MNYGLHAAYALAVLSALVAVVSALAADQIVTGKLTTTPSAVTAEITIAPGWHINAAQPKDPFLIPTRLTLVPAAGTSVGEVRYPDAVDRILPFSAGKPMV